MPAIEDRDLGPTDPPIIIVLSGPSGVGKDAVIGRMRELGYPIVMPVTMTTRSPRPGEVNGEHYIFVTHQEFQSHLAEGELLEHAEVYGGNFYGVPRSSVRAAANSGKHIIIRVDVQGAKSLRKTLPDAEFVFLIPSRRENLEAHLRSRGSEDEAAIQERLAAIEREYDEIEQFRHVIQNVEGDLDDAVHALAILIRGFAGTAGRPPIDV